MTSIDLERTYPHPIERVWRALTDSDRLAAWLMPNDFLPEVGREFTLRTDPGPGFDGIVRCRVLELSPPAEVPTAEKGPREAQMLWSWIGGPIDTEVLFVLREVPGGTRLEMRQSGFRGFKAWLVSRILAAGSRTLYGKHLPRVLGELERDEQGPGSANPSEHPECMTPSQGVIQRLLSLLERKKR